MQESLPDRAERHELTRNMLVQERRVSEEEERRASRINRPGPVAAWSVDGRSAGSVCVSLERGRPQRRARYVSAWSVDGRSRGARWDQIAQTDPLNTSSWRQWLLCAVEAETDEFRRRCVGE